MDGNLCIVTEFLSLGNLWDVIEANTSADGSFTLPWEKRINFALHTCSGASLITPDNKS